jgi:CRP-like cAMP-binding protein
VAGSGFLLPAEVLRDEWSRGGTLQHLLMMHMDTVATQMAHGVMCNRLHTLEERLSRWLLLIQDLVGGHSLGLANPFIAALLGVRLSGVPVALGALQQAGFICRTESEIQIIDRPQLEASACECYAALHHRHKLWQQSLASVRKAKC